MRFGVCWYPEQWPRSRWETDAALMAELGLDLVRIGEFAWSRYEPARGRFEWGWLDEAVEVLADAGLQVVLGTPTATPPVWLATERPEILSVGPDGRRRAYGSRRHTSPSSAAYREEAARVVTALVERYGRHPAVVAWQLDNEPGNHDSARCWSDESQAAFSRWLEQRYGTIEALNAAWGTVFWSGDYPSFADVRLPVPTMTGHTPSLLLAHQRFATSEVLAGLAEQRAIVVAGSPGRDVFTNLYLGDVDVDGQAVARPNGLGAVDMYPHGLSGPFEVGFLHDLARGSALAADAGADERGGRAWIVEQQPGPVNWTGDNPAVPDGQVRLWSWQAALHGIEGLLWFRWRRARAAQEQHHAALLRHDASPDQAWPEVRRFLAEVRAVDPAVLERPVATTALVVDYGDAWLLGAVPQVDDPRVAHRQLCVAAHTAARRLGLDVDVVPVDADLSSYELVLAPALHQLTPDRVARLEAALDAGATVVLGPRSLLRDEHGLWVDEPTPAGLVDRLGARVLEAGNPGGWPRDRRAGDEPWPFAVATRVALGDAEVVDAEVVDTEVVDAEVVDAGGWLETFGSLDGTDALPADVDVLARGVGGPLAGQPVVVRRGGLVAVGAAAADVWLHVLADLTGRTPAPDHLEVFERAGRTVTLDHRTLHVDGLDAH